MGQGAALTPRCGVYVPTYGEFADPGKLIELGCLAAERGWDGFFLWDHIIIDRDHAVGVCDAWPVLGALAHVTSGIQLGPLITPLARREVGKVAHEVATLDQLSGGRMILGVGLGIDNDYSAFGHPTDLRWRAATVDAGIEALRGLWSGEPVSQDGDVVLDRASVLPRPVQAPLPIWTAIRWPGSGAQGPIRRAARAQGVFPVLPKWQPPDAVLSPEDVASLVAVLGSDLPAGYVVAHGGCSTGPETLAPYAEAGMNYWLEAFHPKSHTLEEAFARVEAGPPRG